MDRHDWDAIGERCVKCGAKDWMGGECSSSASPACSIAESRKEFEAWYEADAMPLEHSNWFKRDKDGDYTIDHVDTSWRAWQAARQYNASGKGQEAAG